MLPAGPASTCAGRFASAACRPPSCCSPPAAAIHRVVGRSSAPTTSWRSHSGRAAADPHRGAAPAFDLLDAGRGERRVVSPSATGASSPVGGRHQHRQALELSRLEVRLLPLLHRAPGRLVSRRMQLLDEVWGLSSPTSDADGRRPRRQAAPQARRHPLLQDLHRPRSAYKFVRYNNPMPRNRAELVPHLRILVLHP